MKKPLLLTTYYMMREYLGEILVNETATSAKGLSIIMRINKVRAKRIQLRNEYEKTI